MLRSVTDRGIPASCSRAGSRLGPCRLSGDLQPGASPSGRAGLSQDGLGQCPARGRQAGPAGPATSPGKHRRDSSGAFFAGGPVVAGAPASPWPSPGPGCRSPRLPRAGTLRRSCTGLAQLALPSKLEKPRLTPPTWGPQLLNRTHGPALGSGVCVWGSRRGWVGAETAVCTQHPREGLAEPRLSFADEKAEVVR